MKMIIISALCAASLFGIKPTTENFNIKEVDKSLVKITPELYASKTEVTNYDYAKFLSFLSANKDEKALVMAGIDSMNWKFATSHSEPYAEYYHTHAAYFKYPVVNISYSGAELYCKWLTEEYNKNSKRKFQKVVFRLPSEAEWIMAAKGGNPEATYPWEGTSLKDKKGNNKSNFRRDSEIEMGELAYLKDDADVTAPVLSYAPNAFGLYNMSGNVAEMVSEKGKTKGGSWRDDVEYIAIDAPQNPEDNYAPSPTVGFRYFMEIIEN